MHILIIDSDQTATTLLSLMLEGHQISCARSGEEGLQLALAGADLVILDSNLPGMDGSATCKQLKEVSALQGAPIIFLSTFHSIDDRLRAYGAGAVDYLTKPYDLKEVKGKIDLHLRMVEHQRNREEQLHSTQWMLMQVQTSSAKLQSISRFLQCILFCRDIDTLFRYFFHTAREIEVEGVLRIFGPEGVETRSSSGGVSSLEQEILDLSSGVERIHTFGKDRAIYRWSNAVFLTRGVGDLIDTLAIFMDGLEAGIKSILAQAELLKQVERLNLENVRVRGRVASLFGEMNSEIGHTILSLGIISALEAEDEERLGGLVEEYYGRIDRELAHLGENNSAMEQLIQTLQEPPPALKAMIEAALDSEDGVTLF